jgi:hypothetical protein
MAKRNTSTKSISSFWQKMKYIIFPLYLIGKRRRRQPFLARKSRVYVEFINATNRITYTHVFATLKRSGSNSKPKHT